MIEIILPFPPSVNTYWRYGRLANGRRMHMISKKGRVFAGEVAGLVSTPPLTCRLAVQITLCPPDKRKRDIDNYLKATLDALTKAGAWEDDEQIDWLSVKRGAVVKGGKAVVQIAEAE